MPANNHHRGYLPIKHEQLSQLASDGVRYAAIELIEIGGDHLDRMMALTRTNPHLPPLHAATQQPPPSLALALRRSEQLVRSSHRTIYFLNAATLLHTDASTTQSDELPRLRVSSPAFWQLARRLQYLSNILPAGQRVRFHLCRVPSRAIFSAGGQWETRGIPHVSCLLSALSDLLFFFFLLFSVAVGGFQNVFIF